MTNTEYAIAMLTAIRDCNKFVMTGENHNCGDGTCEACKLYPYVYVDKSKKIEALGTAIKHMEAWEKIDDEIASLRDTYSIGTTDTEKAIWENLQAVRKTIHEYLKEVSE